LGKQKKIKKKEAWSQGVGTISVVSKVVSGGKIERKNYW
jgi:hypothetical protein